MTQTQLVTRVLKPLMWVAALEPAAWLVYNAFWGDLGVNPVETITNHTGIWTLRFIVLTLAVTPVRWLTGWNPLTRFRRPLGLFAFFFRDFRHGDFNKAGGTGLIGLFTLHRNMPDPGFGNSGFAILKLQMAAIWAKRNRPVRANTR